MANRSKKSGGKGPRFFHVWLFFPLSVRKQNSPAKIAGKGEKRFVHRGIRQGTGHGQGNDTPNSKLSRILILAVAKIQGLPIWGILAKQAKDRIDSGPDPYQVSTSRTGKIKRRRHSAPAFSIFHHWTFGRNSILTRIPIPAANL